MIVKKFTFKDIEFVIEEQYANAVLPPEPAMKHLPDWYTKMSPDNPPNEWGYERVLKEGSDIPKTVPTRTVKACAPFLDALSAGYYILAPCDIDVLYEEHGLTFTWPMEIKHDLIQYHEKKQLPGCPLTIDIHPHGAVKFVNFWNIITPPGYSCLFINPMNRPLAGFHFFSGIVDTDQYTSKVNFPGQWIREEEHYRIKKGTPLIQVIPFKRDNWQSRVVADDDRVYEVDTKNTNRLLTVWKNRYKSLFWNKKTFR